MSARWFLTDFLSILERNKKPKVQNATPEICKLYMWELSTTYGTHEPIRVVTQIFYNISAHCNIGSEPREHYKLVQKFIAENGGTWEPYDDWISFKTPEEALQFRLTWS